MGIVGFGRIGKAVAEVGKAMGMKINVTDVIDVEEEASAMGPSSWIYAIYWPVATS